MWARRLEEQDWRDVPVVYRWRGVLDSHLNLLLDYVYVAEDLQDVHASAGGGVVQYQSTYFDRADVIAEILAVGNDIRSMTPMRKPSRRIPPVMTLKLMTGTRCTRADEVLHHCRCGRRSLRLRNTGWHEVI